MVNKSAMFNCFVSLHCGWLWMAIVYVVPLGFRAAGGLVAGGGGFYAVGVGECLRVVVNSCGVAHLNSLGLCMCLTLDGLPSFMNTNTQHCIRLSEVVINFTSPSWRWISIILTKIPM